MVDLTTRTLRFYNYATLFVFRYYAPRINSLSFFARIVFKSLSSTKSILFYGSGYAFKLFPQVLLRLFSEPEYISSSYYIN